MEKTLYSQKLGTVPIPKLLWKMSTPAILSMCVQSLYNIVDSIFVSHISENALTAVSLAFPMQMLVLAIALGLGIGSSSIISRKLGEKNCADANKIATNGCFITLLTTIFFAVFGFFIATLYALLFTEKGSEIYVYCRDYLAICMCVSFGMYFDIYATKIMQAIGKMVIPMVTQIVGALTNIVLDYIFIFGKLGFPAMGVQGAALATVCGQIVAMIISVTWLLTHNYEISIRLKGFKPDKNSLSQILKIGLPVTIMNSVSSLAVSMLNGILIVISKTAVAVLGVYFKIQSFVFMPIFGLNQGALPILAYNFGANERKRFNTTLRICFVTSYVIVLIGFCIFQFLPQQLLSLFEPSPEMLSIGTRALKIISTSFIFAGAGIIIINMFQSIGHGFKSMIMSLLRQLIFLLPIAFLLSKVSTLDNIWYSFPIAECVTTLIFIPIAIKTINKAFALQQSFVAPTEDLNEPSTNA